MSLSVITLRLEFVMYSQMHFINDYFNKYPIKQLIKIKFKKKKYSSNNRLSSNSVEHDESYRESLRDLLDLVIPDRIWTPHLIQRMVP